MVRKVQNQYYTEDTSLGKLLKKSNLDDDQSNLVLETVKICVESKTKSSFLLTSICSLKTYYRDNREDKHHLLLQWSPISHEDAVDSIITIQDITEIEQAQQLINEKNRRNEILQALIVNLGPSLESKLVSLLLFVKDPIEPLKAKTEISEKYYPYLERKFNGSLSFL